MTNVDHIDPREYSKGLDHRTDRHVRDLAARRAKLESPVERILFDNDPANGSIAARIEVMLSEPDNAR